MRGKTSVLVVLALLFLLPSAYALGIGTPYFPDNTISLEKGKSMIFTVTLQNPQDVEMKVTFSLNGKGIAKLVEDKTEFILEPKSYGNSIDIELTMPEDAETFYVYTISYSLTALLDAEGGVIGINPTVNGKVKVKAIPRQGEEVPEVIKTEEVTEVQETEDLEESFERIETLAPKKINPNLLLTIFLVLVIMIVVVLLFNKSLSLVTVMKIKDEEVIEEVKKEIKEIQIPPEKYFYLQDGGVIKNIYELLHNLRTMEEHVFFHHVNSEKNDFANWIRHVFEKHNLANELQNKKDKHKIIETISKHLR